MGKSQNTSKLSPTSFDFISRQYVVRSQDGSKVSAGRQDGTRPTGDEGVVSRFSFPGCDVLYGVAHKRGNRGGT